MFGSRTKTLGMVAVAALFTIQSADAHGPTRKKVEQSIEINASPDTIWKVMGNFQDVSWMAGVKSVTGSGGNAIDAKDDDNEVAHRTLTLDKGGQIVEGLYKYDPSEHSYSYRIDKVDVKVLPVNDFSSTISVDADGSGKSKVSWVGRFYRGYMNNDPPPELDDEASMAAVKKYFENSLESLKKKVEANG